MTVTVHFDGRVIAQHVAAYTQSSTRKVTYEPIEGTDGLLSTVYNVEVCATGIEYPLASGPMTFTEDDLRAAVASQDDPSIHAPRVWLGHPDDDRFHAGRATPAGSAEPALGKVVNLRLDDNDQVAVGDVVGCPTWLAKILASAYPSRSIEGFKDAETVTGHKWKLVITDLALLGVTWPGVSTLDDLEALYSEDGPSGVEVKEDVPLTVAASRAITAQVNIDDVRRAFYAALPEMDIDTWSWIRAMQIDPNELIVDDDQGSLFRVSFEVEGEAVTFGDPEEVKIKYVNASQKRDPQARTLLVNYFTSGRKVAASWDQKAESRLDNDPGGHSMTPEQLRASLGLPADATDEQVTAKITELTAAAGITPSPDQVGEGPTKGPGAPASGPVPSTAGTTPGSTTETPSPDQAGAPSNGGPGLTPTPPVAASATASSLPPGMVAVPADAWASMQASVQTITADRQATREEADVKTVGEAIKAGKVFPHQRGHYEQRVKDPATRDAFIHLLTAAVDQGGLAPNLVPVEARGGDEPTNQPTEAYPAEWLPEIAASRDARQPAAVTQEG